MTDSVYRQLAQRLNALPNGFPPAASGAEIRLLQKIFAPEEAALAAVMRHEAQSAGEIAATAGVDAKEARQLLKGMVRKGLITLKKKDRQLAFELMPFVVGFYEEQLPRMDAEMATLFEEYFQETRGGGVAVSPSVHRVIPVERSITLETEIQPFAQASRLVEEAQAWGVRDCICRVQQKLIGKGCDHPIENCLVFAPYPNIFDHNETIRALSKDEALRILKEAADSGLVHSTANHRDNLTYICNCCTCCCGVTRSIVEFGISSAVAHSDFYAVVNEDECLGCGDCERQCQFEAITLPGDTAEVSYARCVGCGQCVTVCATDALSMALRPAEDLTPPPADIKAWAAQRAQNRGLPMDEVL